MKPWYSSALGRILIMMVLMALWALSSLAKADVIEFPEEELSRESVLPVFDQPQAVKKRFVPTDERIELDVVTGLSLNDPFLSNVPAGLSVGYHLNEVHAIALQAAYVATSQTGYPAQIQQQVRGADSIPFDLNPGPRYWVLGEYEFTPYYGKISLSKQNVMNLNISGTVRAGMMGLTDSTSSFTGGLGINERFFFTRNFGLKLDLSGLIYSKGDIIPYVSGQRAIVANTTATTFFFMLGAVWYFPTL